MKNASKAPRFSTDFALRSYLDAGKAARDEAFREAALAFPPGARVRTARGEVGTVIPGGKSTIRVRLADGRTICQDPSILTLVK